MPDQLYPRIPSFGRLFEDAPHPQDADVVTEPTNDEVIRAEVITKPPDHHNP